MVKRHREIIPIFEQFEITTMLYLVQVYVNRAILQYDRIKNMRENLKKIRKKLSTNQSLMLKHSEYMTEYFADLHFYFICWGDFTLVYRKLKKIRKDFALPKKSERELIKHKNVRDDLEHIDERVLKNVNIKILGGMNENEFTVEGRHGLNRDSIIVDETDLNKLENIFFEVLEIAREKWT